MLASSNVYSLYCRAVSGNLKQMRSLIKFLTLLFLLVSCKSNPPKLDCTFNQESFIESIQNYFNADSVKITTSILQEEIYFSKLVTVRIFVSNPTTHILNFKELNVDEPIRFDNYDEIENALKEDGKKFAEEIIQSCNLSKFNDLIIEYNKPDIKGNLHYRFINHYEEFMLIDYR